MHGLALVLVAAVINWFVTTIFVESHLFEPARNWVIRQGYQVYARGEWHRVGNRHAYVWPEDTTEEEYEKAQPPVLRGSWAKLAQLVTCQMCMRTWVGFAEAFYFGGPDRGFARFIVNGLLYAGLGHLIFEARSRVALILPKETNEP